MALVKASRTALCCGVSSLRCIPSMANGRGKSRTNGVCSQRQGFWGPVRALFSPCKNSKSSTVLWRNSRLVIRPGLESRTNGVCSHQQVFLGPVRALFLPYKNSKSSTGVWRNSRLVIRLGLEPRTPTLKVLCSTC